MRQPKEIPDEEHEQVLERVAAIDVAKASGMVCTRVPHPQRAGKRRTLVWEVPAVTNAVLELGEQLAAERIRKVTLEATSDYWQIWLRREAPCCIPGLAGRNLEDIPGSDGLLKIRKVKAAATAARTDTFLGERYRRIVKRRGKLKALVAVARSILVIVWHLLTNRAARYRDLRPRLLHQPHRQKRKTRNHIRQLEALGYTVTLAPAA
jgi:transposase